MARGAFAGPVSGLPASYRISLAGVGLRGAINFARYMVSTVKTKRMRKANATAIASSIGVCMAQLYNSYLTRGLSAPRRLRGLEPRLRKTEIFPAATGGSRNTSQLRSNVRKARSMKYVALESDESCL